MEDRFERGKKKLAEINDRAAEEILQPLGDLGRYIIEFAYGDVYSREELNLRDRQMITVAILTVLGREPQLKVHLAAAIRAGISVEELREIIIHTVPYAGFPTAMDAMAVLNEVIGNQEG
jgi:4-carboxymuconolactone decarboxylase